MAVPGCVAARRGDHQVAAGAGDRDVEQPAPSLSSLAARAAAMASVPVPGTSTPAAASISRPCRAGTNASAGRARRLPDPGHHDDIPPRPFARCAVRMRTASPSGARSARVSPGISWPDMLSRKSEGEPGGSRTTNRPAASNRAHTASRSRSAAAPREPPAAEVDCHSSARPDASHTAQSTSWALPSCAVWRASASRPATRCAASVAVPRSRVSSRGSARTAASGWGGGSSPASRAAARSARRSRRSPRASVPPSWPASSSTAASSSRASGCRAQRSNSSSGRTPGSASNGSSSPAMTEARRWRPAPGAATAPGR